MIHPYDEDVNGIIIGGEGAPVRARLFYDGRPQGRDDHFADADAAIAYGRAEAARLSIEHPYTFTNQALWEIRIY